MYTSEYYSAIKRSYRYMLQHGQISRGLCSVKEDRQKRLHTILFIYTKFLEKVKLHRKKADKSAVA